MERFCICFYYGQADDRLSIAFCVRYSRSHNFRTRVFISNTSLALWIYAANKSLSFLRSSSLLFRYDAGWVGTCGFLRSFCGKTKSFADAGVVEKNNICCGRAGECRSLIIGYFPGYVTMSPGWPYNKPDVTIERNYTLFGRHDTRKTWPTQLSMILCTFSISENFR